MAKEWGQGNEVQLLTFETIPLSPFPCQQTPAAHTPRLETQPSMDQLYWCPLQGLAMGIQLARDMGSFEIEQ
jgi:hypothetical protein